MLNKLFRESLIENGHLERMVKRVVGKNNENQMTERAVDIFPIIKWWWLSSHSRKKKKRCHKTGNNTERMELRVMSKVRYSERSRKSSSESE